MYIHIRDTNNFHYFFSYFTFFVSWLIFSRITDYFSLSSFGELYDLFCVSSRACDQFSMAPTRVTLFFFVRRLVFSPSSWMAQMFDTKRSLITVPIFHILKFPKCCQLFRNNKMVNSQLSHSLPLICILIYMFELTLFFLFFFVLVAIMFVLV